VKHAAVTVLAVILGGCTSLSEVYREVTPGMASGEVAARVGKPTAVGKLADGGAYWDYSRQPYRTDRVSFGPDDRVVAVRNLLTEQNFERLKPGMTLNDVRAVVGPPVLYGQYADRTTVWTYRYQDVGIWKLLHVTLDADGRMLRYATEWDPDIYSKRDRGGR
jgi:outer membrane protein assembly factor BamE (lipoprotein component of BamABCDE complex)